MEYYLIRNKKSGGYMMLQFDELDMVLIVFESHVFLFLCQV